ncbi:MAG: AraC family transcriptional regulator [Actinomycetota bacterium]
MSRSLLADLRGPTPIAGFNPQAHPLLPVEAIPRAELRHQQLRQRLAGPHRHDFHQLIVCHGGEGMHVVDQQPIEMRRGRVLHVHPGQVHEYRFEPDFEAWVVVYRDGLPQAVPPGGEWFPGSTAPVRWDFVDDEFDAILCDVKSIADEQDRFDGSVGAVMLIESLLATLFARVHRHDGVAADSSTYNETFVRYRRLVEEHFRHRPTVAWCARELGYSVRTLDRACHSAVGQSAKAVLDDRVALDIRRLLVHTDASVTNVGAAFDFHSASSFTKFVNRHLGASPSAIRAAGA